MLVASKMLVNLFLALLLKANVYECLDWIAEPRRTVGLDSDAVSLLWLVWVLLLRFLFVLVNYFLRCQMKTMFLWQIAEPMPSAAPVSCLFPSTSCWDEVSKGHGRADSPKTRTDTPTTCVFTFTPLTLPKPHKSKSKNTQITRVPIRLGRDSSFPAWSQYNQYTFWSNL